MVCLFLIVRILLIDLFAKLNILFDELKNLIDQLNILDRMLSLMLLVHLC
jgi:hypothetical protein